MVSTPAGWATDRMGSRSATFRNETYELAVKVEPRYQASVSQRRGRAQEPKTYLVRVVQDWFSEGVHGDRSMSATVATWEEALTTAQEFMAEFSDERTTQPRDEVEAVHRAVDDHGLADQILTTEAAAEALVDAVGYSDDLLLAALASEVDDQYLLVAHRDGDEVDVVDGAEHREAVPLGAVHAAFPLDRQGVESLLETVTPVTTVVHLGEYTVYRFHFGYGTETDVVLPRGTQVVSPAFEQVLANVLEEKW